MHKKITYCILGIAIFCIAYAHGQVDFESEKEAALRLYDIAKEKRKDYVEVDSIYHYLVESKKIAKKINYDSLIFHINNDLAYWSMVEADGSPIPALLQENRVINQSIQYENWEHAIDVSYAKYLVAQEDSLGSNRDSIEYYYQKVIDEALPHKDYVHYMIASNLLAEYLMENKDWSRPIESILLNALEVRNMDHETKIIQIHTQALLGKYYLLIKDYERCISTLSPLPVIDYKIIDYGWMYSYLSEAYLALGDYKNAYLNTVKAKTYSDSLATFNRHLAIQRTKYEYDTEQKEKLIEQLKENDKLRTLTAKKQANFVRIVLLFALIIIVLLVLLVRNKLRKIKADNDLIQAQNETAKIKSRLFTNITHEFRTPLTVILGMADKIKGNCREKELISRNGQQLMDMVSQILDLSKSESGALDLKYIQGEIIAYLSYLTNSFKLLASRDEINLTFYSECEELYMDFDPKQLKHIISNLLANALKFTDKHGQVVVHVKKIDDNLVINVRDNGIGMSGKDLKHIFNRFYQGDNYMTKQVGGTGIGMAFVKELVDLMRGEIEVTSKVHKGTNVTLKLPIHNVELVREVEHKLPQHTENGYPNQNFSWISSERQAIALVIEDNDDLQTYVESCIEKEFKVVKAYDGENGIEKALELIPDIIICDIMMPRMDGYEVTQKLKEDYRTNHIPIILLTAKATQNDRLSGLESGADAYLTKPFQEEELKVRMDKLIELRNVLQQRYSTENSFQREMKKEDPFLMKITEIMEVNFQDEDFGVHELALKLNLSRMQVHRKIKAITDFSTTKFMNHFRLEKAYGQLVNSDQNISEVAYASGFSDPKYFSRLFMEKYGMNPSELK